MHEIGDYETVLDVNIIQWRYRDFFVMFIGVAAASVLNCYIWFYFGIYFVWYLVNSTLLSKQIRVH